MFIMRCDGCKCDFDRVNFKSFDGELKVLCDGCLIKIIEERFEIKIEGVKS